MIVIIHLQRGIPSKRKSSTCIDYVPALCTLACLQRTVVSHDDGMPLVTAPRMELGNIFQLRGIPNTESRATYNMHVQLSQWSIRSQLSTVCTLHTDREAVHRLDEDGSLSLREET